jgi:PhnB protein
MLQPLKEIELKQPQQKRSLSVYYIPFEKQMTMARVSTYLNFPRNTEEVFNFYKSVFGGEFGGDGIARFSDIPSSDDIPPFSEQDKNLIMHIELPLPGGHVLMGTDAPETMGFTVNFGNNIHISLEPDTKAETKKLFDALSDGGIITTDLGEMFWGAYYGSCIDKFGVRWMFNCSEK